jgi:hypothetical protein
LIVPHFARGYFDFSTNEITNFTDTVLGCEDGIHSDHLLALTRFSQTLACIYYGIDLVSKTPRIIFWRAASRVVPTEIAYSCPNSLSFL